MPNHSFLLNSSLMTSNCVIVNVKVSWPAASKRKIIKCLDQLAILNILFLVYVNIETSFAWGIYYIILIQGPRAHSIFLKKYSSLEYWTKKSIENPDNHPRKRFNVSFGHNSP